MGNLGVCSLPKMQVVELCEWSTWSAHGHTPRTPLLWNNSFEPLPLVLAEATFEIWHSQVHSESSKCQMGTGRKSLDNRVAFSAQNLCHVWSWSLTLSPIFLSSSPKIMSSSATPVFGEKGLTMTLISGVSLWTGCWPICWEWNSNRVSFSLAWLIWILCFRVRLVPVHPRLNDTMEPETDDISNQLQRKERMQTSNLSWQIFSHPLSGFHK